MISGLDTFISACYILVMVGIGFWVGVAHRKGATKGSLSAGYFLAGQSLRWPMIGLALFATNISCIHLVSLAQSGFDTGLLNGNFEWMAAFTLILLALFFVPFYIKSGVPTLPVFMEQRYNSACRDWLTVISLVSAVVLHIAFSLLAGGIVIEALFGVDMYISVSAISVLVALYTIIGGLRAVVVTESVQTIVLVAGALVITVAAWMKLGGWGALVDTLQTTGDMDKLSMLRPKGDSSGMAWYAIFLGYPVLGIWYWCADQTIVQRVLGAKDENHARIGALFCGFIKILPVFIFVLPGLFAYALAQNGQLDLSSITSAAADGKADVNSKGIYTLMITQLLPTGLVGVVVAALLSGLMSQVSGALNSIATLVSYDLIKRHRPHVSDSRLIGYGRWSAAVALVLSIGLLPLLNRYESLFVGLNDIIAHIAPPITCVFLLGVFWKRASAVAAKWTLWIGSLLGVMVYATGKLFPGGLIGQVPFMMMAFYLFCACVLLQVMLSVWYPAVHNAVSGALYWKSPWEPLRRPAWKGLGNYKLLSALLLITMAILYVFFN
ncbi:sodium:solute symporter [Parapedobacter soli]|uniref:sodium:solute symporter n=1 Tax=Parapedobacter soli TaxID=416955 RepID=UPI0021C805CD|nr:sodium:solute symporter [Parapedobacter soli]